MYIYILLTVKAILILARAGVDIFTSELDLIVVWLLKMVYSTYKRQQILHYYFQGYKAPTIAHLLREESLLASRRGVDKFLKKYQETGSIVRPPGSGRPSKVMREVKRLVEQQMRLNDETTAYQLHELLKTHMISVSLRTVLHCRTLWDGHFEAVHTAS